MKRRTLFSILAALSIGFIAEAMDKEKPEPKKQTHCPVMQRYEIDKNNYIDVKGYRIYTCCKGCINQIKANPDKYIKRLEDQGVVIAKVPTTEQKKTEQS